MKKSNKQTAEQKELINKAFLIGLTVSNRMEQGILKEWQKAPCQDSDFMNFLGSEEVKNNSVFGFASTLITAYEKGKYQSFKVSI